MPTPQIVTWPSTGGELTAFAETWGLLDGTAVRAALLSWLLQQLGGSPLTIISGRRTCAWQRAHHQEYLAGLAANDAAPHSWHLVGRAFDVADLEAQLTPVATEVLRMVVPRLGMRWGGDFATPDPNHFDWPGPSLPAPCW